jgi:hypothetical protein
VDVCTVTVPEVQNTAWGARRQPSIEIVSWESWNVSTDLLNFDIIGNFELGAYPPGLAGLSRLLDPISCTQQPVASHVQVKWSCDWVDMTLLANFAQALRLLAERHATVTLDPFSATLRTLQGGADWAEAKGHAAGGG